MRLFPLLLLAYFAAACSGNPHDISTPEQESDPVMQAIFPNGKPIGQPLSRNHTGIRMVRVDSYAEACEWFTAICGGNITQYTYQTHIYYLYSLPDGTSLVFTNKASAGSNEVAALHIFSGRIISAGISEIRFVETTKPK